MLFVEGGKGSTEEASSQCHACCLENGRYFHNPNILWKLADEWLTSTKLTIGCSRLFQLLKVFRKNFIEVRIR